MLSRISLWAISIGTGITIIFMQSIAEAQNLVEIPAPATIFTVAIAETTGRGSVNSFASALRKYQKGDYQGALADYDRAIQFNPKNANAYYNRGLLKATKLQDYQGALADYDRSIKLKPTNDEAYNNRGNLKVESLKDYQGALLDYNRAIELRSQNANAYYNRGVLKYTFLTDRPGGIADLQQAAKLAQKQGKAEDYQAATDLIQQWQQPAGNWGLGTP